MDYAFSAKEWEIAAQLAKANATLPKAKRSVFDSGYAPFIAIFGDDPKTVKSLLKEIDVDSDRMWDLVVLGEAKNCAEFLVDFGLPYKRSEYLVAHYSFVPTLESLGITFDRNQQAEFVGAALQRKDLSFIKERISAKKLGSDDLYPLYVEAAKAGRDFLVLISNNLEEIAAEDLWIHGLAEEMFQRFPDTGDLDVLIKRVPPDVAYFRGHRFDTVVKYLLDNTSKWKLWLGESPASSSFAELWSETADSDITMWMKLGVPLAGRNYYEIVERVGFDRFMELVRAGYQPFISGEEDGYEICLDLLSSTSNEAQIRTLVNAAGGGDKFGAFLLEHQDDGSPRYTEALEFLRKMEIVLPAT